MTLSSALAPNPAFDDFLQAAGWRGAAVSPLAVDASTRSYFRVSDTGRRAVLMSAPPAAETASCSPTASAEERQRLGYNATARLAGPNLNAFLTIANALREAGISAPEIYAADPHHGLALIEDLGDGLIAKVVTSENERTLYENAIDVLSHLHANAPAPPNNDAYQMLDYDRLALEAEADLLIEWYWPLKKGAAPDQAVVAAFRVAVDETLSGLGGPKAIVLRDYHAENLLWLPDREGQARVGVIDFQDGLIGSPAYDLVSLLEDARRDVDPELAIAMIGRYIFDAERRGAFDRDQFLTDYAILALQRNAKILGVFARLANRDGKKRYLDLLPRVEAHFRNDLARPPAAPLKRFCTEYFPELIA